MVQIGDQMPGNGLNYKERQALRVRLKRRGFDLTKSSAADGVRPRCSQCQVTVIQGVATHEQGCPNARR